MTTKNKQPDIPTDRPIYHVDFWYGAIATFVVLGSILCVAVWYAVRHGMMIIYR